MTWWRDLLTYLRPDAGIRPFQPDVAHILDAAERVPTGLSRRHFLRTALIGTAAVATVDLEQLLWLPGEKTFFLPAVPTVEELNTFLSADWIAKESLRILQQQLQLSKHVFRHYPDEAVRLGDTVNIRLPSRFEPVAKTGFHLVAPVKPVILDSQLMIDIESPSPHWSRKIFVEKELVPKMAELAEQIERRGLDTFGRLPLAAGMDEAAFTHNTDGTGPVVRVLKGYSVSDNRNLIRVDVLGGASR